MLLMDIIIVIAIAVGIFALAFIYFFIQDIRLMKNPELLEEIIRRDEEITLRNDKIVRRNDEIIRQNNESQQIVNTLERYIDRSVFTKSEEQEIMDLMKDSTGIHKRITELQNQSTALTDSLTSKMGNAFADPAKNNVKIKKLSAEIDEVQKQIILLLVEDAAIFDKFKNWLAISKQRLGNSNQHPSGTQIQKIVSTCKNCGASNNMTKEPVIQCEYCGSYFQ